MRWLRIWRGTEVEKNDSVMARFAGDKERLQRNHSSRKQKSE
jgi:hypothetical protein